MAENRVVRLRAAAIQLAASRLLGVQLKEQDALSMATHAGLAPIMAMVRERLVVKRGPQQLASDTTFQHSLAIGAVRLELANPGPEGEEKVRLLVQEAVKARLDHDSRRKLMMEDVEEFEQLIDRLNDAGWEFRRFTRRARRLYNIHRQQLMQGIRDSTRRDRAVEELVALYCRYFEDAVGVFERISS